MNYGRFNLILGPMYSGKTSELLRRLNRYKIAKKKCLLIKFDEDNRYDDEYVCTHDQVKHKAVKCNKLEKVNNIITNYDVICIDEVQFYSDSSIYCDKWANDGKIVEACGLNGDFNKKPFEQITKLIPQVDDLIFLKAVDKNTGQDAPFTFRLSNNKEQKVIGGLDIYSAVSRTSYIRNFV